MKRTLTEIKYFSALCLANLQEEIDDYINESPCPKIYEFEAGQIAVAENEIIIQPIFIYKLG